MGETKIKEKRITFRKILRKVKHVGIMMPTLMYQETFPEFSGKGYI
jgi:hypothetical protein